MFWRSKSHEIQLEIPLNFTHRVTHYKQFSILTGERSENAYAKNNYLATVKESNCFNIQGLWERFPVKVNTFSM